MTEEEELARTAALEQQILRTIYGHIDSLDPSVAALIACNAAMSALVVLALTVHRNDVDQAVRMIRDAPWKAAADGALAMAIELAKERP